MARTHPTASFLTLTVAATLSVLPAAGAEDLPDTQMAAHQFSGVVNSDNVYVRSYAGEDQYPVAQLSKGDPLVAVGSNGDWVKVLPPPGVVCLVGKAWIDGRGDGSVGRVRDVPNNVNVRIMSNVLKGEHGKIVAEIKPGDDVTILGEQDEYYKISPPPGAFAYVHKRFVDLVKPVDVIVERGTMVVKQTGATLEPTTPVSNNGVKPTPVAPATLPAGASLVKLPTTQPLVAEAANVPSTQPVAASGQAAFDALEADFKTATNRPLAEQPIDTLLTGYQKVIDDKAVPESVLRLAEYRLAGLKLRKEAVATLASAEQTRKAQEAQQLPLQAEAKEIDQRMKANDFKRYTAVGTLRTSALPQNGRTLYRLTDPASGRTVIYLDTADAKVTGMEGSFIGVRGPIAEDATRQIKVLSPQSAEAVDPAELVSGSVSSGLVPPSMASGGAAAQ